MAHQKIQVRGYPANLFSFVLMDSYKKRLYTKDGGLYTKDGGKPLQRADFPTGF